MLKSLCLVALMSGVLSAQESRPEAEPFVRVLPGNTGSPWPAGKEPLWVVTADPFLFSASAAYAQGTLECLALALRILFETCQGLERSDWARAQPAEWQRLREPIQQVLDAWDKDVRDPSLADTDQLEGALRALGRLAVTAEWQDSPLPAGALDQRLRTRWLQLRDVVAALWGDARSGSDGWFAWVAAGGKDARLVKQGLLPRVADLLAGPAGDPELDALAQAPALGAEGVFATPERTQAFLLRALARLQTDRADPPSVRHALYHCLTCLLEEPAELRKSARPGRPAPAAGVLGSAGWQELRTESAAGLLVRVRPPEHRSVVLYRGGRPPAAPRSCTVVVLMSPRMLAALTELERAWARADSAWTACTGLHLPLSGPSAHLLQRLLAVDPGAADGRAVVLEQPHTALREGLARWAPETGRFAAAFTTALAAPASDPVPRGSWLRQRLRAESMRPVEFRLRIDGQWRWGRGAMAGCDVMTDDNATPLHELWRQGKSK